MRFLLDTNICIYLIKQNPPQVRRKFQAVSPGDVGISAITAAELHVGVQKSQRVSQNQTALAQFLLPLAILPFDNRAAIAYGRLRAFLEQQGTPIGSLDMLIAAHALSLKTILVSNNLQEFSRVPELKLENWIDE